MCRMGSRTARSHGRDALNLEHAETPYAELAPLVDAKAAGLPPQKAAARFVDALAEICRDCGVPDLLAAVGVEEKDLELLATDADEADASSRQ